MKNYLSKEYLEVLDKKYLFNKDKYLSGGGRILLRYILAKLSIEDYIISIDGNGKPFLLSHPNIHFNISHSGDLVLIGVSDKSIGVDIEKIQNLDYIGISKHFFHNREYTKIFNTDSINVFFKILTLKESYVKMKGTGLIDLKSFVVDIDKNLILDCVNRVCLNLNLNSLLMDKEYQIGVCSTDVDNIDRPREVLLSDISNHLNVID
ncbi:MAG: 4'-phosphopantetheinyl transferase superfamily protein [Methanobrevibacter sp.]|jgi:4'-phosphopantetheinyl transferase|nr:4'-phosphopantetheinyl transferase superfamily protein [Candidatus Methanovirga procula]